MNWTEKYRPKSLGEIRGQEQVINEIQLFLEEFPKSKKVIILGGGPGIGKTTIAHAFAKEKNYEIFELNASDLRNKSKLIEILKPAMQQKSLTKNNKLILVDEADGITGTDRGGIPELIRIIEKTTFPVIATANDVWKKSLSALRKKSKVIELKNIPDYDAKNLLIDILKKEGKFLDIKILDKVIKNSKGDLRAAINDIQTLSNTENPEEILIDSRNKEESIFVILKEVFQDEVSNEVLRSFDKSNMSMDEIMLWIEENIPLVYSGEELAKAYIRLAKADLFKGRIYKQQYWRFLVYQNAFSSYGISASKEKKKEGFFKYTRPERILKIWLNNQKIAKKKAIATKYAEKVHIGAKRALREWPEIKAIIKNPSVQKELKLTEEEIEYVSR